MKRTYHRVGFTAAQSAELWERWRKGEGLIEDIKAEGGRGYYTGGGSYCYTAGSATICN